MNSSITLKLRPLPEAETACSAVCRLRLSERLRVSCSARLFGSDAPAVLRLFWAQGAQTREHPLESEKMPDGSRQFDAQVDAFCMPDALVLYAGEAPIAAAGIRSDAGRFITRKSAAAISHPQEEAPSAITFSPDDSVESFVSEPVEEPPLLVLSSPEEVEAPALPQPPGNVLSIAEDDFPQLMESCPEVSPFMGLMPGARFVRIPTVSVPEEGIDHFILGYIPLGEGGFYMLGVPAGTSWQPPAQLPDFRHYIPGKEGDGYWVKYVDMP